MMIVPDVNPKRALLLARGCRRELPRCQQAPGELVSAIADGNRVRPSGPRGQPAATAPVSQPQRRYLHRPGRQDQPVREYTDTLHVARALFPG